MRFSVESWAPEYGASIEGDELEDASERVDATVERPLAAWAPIEPAPAEHPERILFVDGVRRIDARVWIDAGDRAVPGVCASVAAGAVACRDGSAEVVRAEVRRALIVPSSARDVSDIATAHATYALVRTVGDDANAAYLAIHGRMTELEAELVGAHRADLVVFDGPLRGRNDPLGVGYVKTQHVRYVPDEVLGVIGALAPGQRSPLMLLGASTTLSRWTWYLRLPGPRTHPWAGIVRCELPGTGSATDAIRRADCVSACLPRFASSSHKEPRAPQNLVPIAGLEQRLRHLLGDPVLLERSLRAASQRAA
jgi:hypothetical protein